jgi:hypothetical protein
MSCITSVRSTCVSIVGGSTDMRQHRRCVSIVGGACAEGSLAGI